MASPTPPPGDPDPDSIAERLKQQFGDEIGPTPPLDPEPAPDKNAPSSLFDKLRGAGTRGTRYRLLGEVARGGMGVILKIWDDELRRTLAMKVVLGRGDESKGDTPHVDPKTLGRFLEEAQVTGQLDHPGIVPVHELGLGADGRVYFTMRLVKGEDLRTIFEKVRTGEDGWNQVRALGVMLKVCEAISYAHSKKVVHRDLKPANVMVGKFGEVYVMDWGLARVLGRADKHDLRIQAQSTTQSVVKTERRERRDETPDSPLVTMDGDIVGTPSFMPPEQAKGQLDKLGPHSDVYSLGAMLYQLLTGEMPYVPAGARVSQYAILDALLRRSPDPIESLAPKTPPELVAICEKAMARDLSERYSDTQAFASDLRAYLEGRVVHAYETGTWAETRKWVQRSKPLAAALAAVIVAVASGAISYAIKAQQAEQAAMVARDEAVEARTQRLRADLKADEARGLAASEAEAKGRAIENLRVAELNAKETQAVADYLAQVIQNISPELFGRAIQPRMETVLREELEIAGTSQPNVDAAISQLQDVLRTVDVTTVASKLLQSVVLAPAAEAANQQLASLPGVRAQLSIAIGQAQYCYGLFEEADQTVLLATVACEETLGPTSKWTLRLKNLRVLCLVQRHELQAAEALARSALLACEQRSETLDIDGLATVNNIGFTLLAQDRNAEALEYLLRAADGFESQVGKDDPRGIAARVNVAMCMMLQGKAEASQEILQEIMDRPGFARAASDPMARMGMCNLGGTLLMKGKYAEAESLFRPALVAAEAAVGRAHPHYLLLAINLSASLAAQGRLDEADVTLREALGRLRSDFPVASTMRQMAELQMGTIQCGKGHPEDAAICYRIGRPLLLQYMAEGKDMALSAGSQFATALYESQNYDTALELCEQIVRQYRSRADVDNEQLLSVTYMLSNMLQVKGRRVEAVPYLKEVLAGLELLVPRGLASPLSWANVADNLACLLLDISDLSEDPEGLQEAELLLRRVVEVRTEYLSGQDALTLGTRGHLAMALCNAGRIREGESEIRIALHDAEPARDQLGRAYVLARVQLAFAIRESGNLAKANELFRECLEEQSCFPDTEAFDRMTPLRGLAVCEVRQGHFAEAERLLLEVDAVIGSVPNVSPVDILWAAKNNVALYDAWTRADSDPAISEKLARWQARVEQLLHKD